MQLDWIEYQDEKILYVDYSGMRDKNEMINQVNKAFEMLRTHGKPALVLSNLEDAYISQEFLDRAKSGSKELEHLILKQALLGITGVKKILFNAYNKFTGMKNNKSFESAEEAKEWLVS